MSDSFTQRGGWWVVGQFALMSVIAVLGVICHPERRNTMVVGGGVLLLAVSALCGLAGLMALGRKLTPFPKPVAKAELVRSGIYGLMRHPLYTAVFCAAAGWSLIWQSWPALAVSFGLALFLDAKARREERWLRKQFPDYERYAQKVRRFIPWIY